MDMNAVRSTPSWVLPVAIIAAGIIIATATYVVRMHQHVTKEAGDPSVVRPVTPNDHLIGNPTAPVKIVEYGDMDSEYTKEFNATMAQIMTEYAADGKVAWVFRHFPIIATHPYAAAHASAAECATSLGTPDTFWGFMNALAAQAPGTDQFNPKDYPGIVTGLNIPIKPFTECIAKGTFEKRVQDDYTNAILSGGTGTPYIILIVKGQKPIPVSGALPYMGMKKVLDEAIKRAGA